VALPFDEIFNSPRDDIGFEGRGDRSGAGLLVREQKIVRVPTQGGRCSDNPTHEIRHARSTRELNGGQIPQRARDGI
jgi:hypothetical protein